MIREDLYRIRPHKYSLYQLVQGFRSQGFTYIFFLRKAKSARFLLSKFFYRICLRHYTYKYGFQIPYQAQIGPGLYIGHFGTIIVSVNAIIGKNCNLSPGVTIGRDHRGERRGSPSIGDHVWIGTNAVLVGKITVGNNVLIAPNAFVNFDVPDNSIVLGNPGKIIARENPTEGYINNRI